LPHYARVSGREIVTIAFARESEVMTPAPRSGIATTRAATTRMNSFAQRREHFARQHHLERRCVAGSRCASRSMRREASLL
jgi:hypothetical protein